MLVKTKKKWHGLFLAIAVLLLSSMSAFAQTKSVSGIVSDPSGEPIPGVSVMALSTKAAVITNVDGSFAINANTNDNIKFSFIGYITQTVPVNNQSKINVTLQESSVNLEEVVAIGYGSVKKRDITGSVASISGKDIAAIPVANASQALHGRLPGVNVISQDGRPDASISIRVRGGGSISQSNEPLFVVDGFPVSSISDIPGDQIESIDVLKDASSTAIYGARGANGVIIVTTKKAGTGKTKITYNGYAQFNTPTKYLETMDAYDYVAYNWGYAKAISDNYATAWEKLWAINGQPKADGSSNSAGINYYKDVDATNYSEKMYGNSFSQSHNLNISGGTDLSKMSFALNHIDDSGMKINSYYKRTNASLKLDQKLSDAMLLSFDTRFTEVNKCGDEGTTNGRGSILSSAYFFRPIATSDVLGVLDDTENTYLGMYDNILQDRYNPVARTKDYVPLNRNRAIRANASLDWKVFSGLKFRSELGSNTYWNKSKTWSGPVYCDYFTTAGEQTYGGDASMTASEGWSYRFANTLNYEVQGLGEDHDLTILVGHEFSNSGGESMTISGSKFPVTFNSSNAFAMMDQYLANEVTNTTTGGVTTTTVKEYKSLSSSVSTPGRMISFFGRINYSYLDRYLFTGTFRRDGSSRFTKLNRYGNFPAAALAWRMSEEDFLKDVTFVDNMKLRLSYGSVGNDGISANLWKMLWKSGGKTSYSIGEQQQSYYEPASTTMANNTLKWETTITRNLGLDYGLFNNRVFGTIDAYWNSTVDLLMLTSLPAQTGFSTTYANVGSTSNKGIEIGIGADLVRSKDFNLSANFNINFNHGKVEELAEGVDGLYKTQWGSSMTQPSTGDYQLIEGRPVGLVRGWKVDKNNAFYTTDDFDYEPTTGVYTLKSGVADIATGILGTVYGTTGKVPSGQVAYPGVIKLQDISGPDGTPDGEVDANDLGIIGDMNPVHTGGFNINGNYKALDFLFSFNWSYGNEVYNANYLAAFYGSKEDGLYRNRLSYLNDCYKIYDIQNGALVRVEDPQALTALNQGATTFLPYHENPVCNSLGIQDGSFLRLNNVTFGYTLPKALIGAIGLEKVRFYGTIYNALTFTSYLGLDPEVNTNTSQGSATYPTTGLDWGAYPRARSYTFGLNVEF
jgi:TonB-dependent starch-binding outer membrane protein SusC